MNYDRITSICQYLSSLALLILGGVYRSSAMAYASVAVLGLVVAKDMYDKHQQAKLAITQKQPIIDELKRAVQDLNARVTTIEYNTKVRGF
jgi:putative IMPACT (imprinted ancient) family translation regulator